MKQKMFRCMLGGMALTFALATSFSSSVKATSKVETNFSKAYQSILSKKNSSGSQSSYTLYDIDKDNVPEMIVCTDDSDYQIYTCEGEKPVLCNELYLDYSPCFYSSDDGLISHDGGRGYLHLEYIRLLKLQGNRLEEITLLDGIEDGENGLKKLRSTLQKYQPIDNYVPSTDLSLLNQWVQNKTAKISTPQIVNYALYTDIIATVNNLPLRSYNIDGYTAVVAEDLRSYGFNVVWDGVARELYVSRDNNAKTAGTSYQPETLSHRIGERANAVYATDIVTYVNGKKVESYNIDGETLIWIDDLAAFGTVNWNPTARRISMTFKMYGTMQKNTL